MSSERAAKLAYAGLSLRVDPLHPDQRFRPGIVEGTPYYMSPEQARSSTSLDFRTDMYALGATLYHMLTGFMPFADFSPVDALRRQISGSLTNPSRIVPDLPDSYCFVVEKMMMKYPDARFESWSVLRRAVSVLMEDESICLREESNWVSTVEAP